MTEPGEKPCLLASTDAKLHAVTAIAVAYLIAWYGVSAAPQPATESVPRAPRAAWIDELPSTKRPKVIPPAGWQVASWNEQAAVPALVRAPASRPLRVRTRSS